MIWLARIALRLASLVGLRWMLAAAFGRFVLRRLGRGAVERAAAELETRARDHLPAPAARAVAALPAPVLNAGGSAVVASRAARSAVAGGRRAHRATRQGRDRFEGGLSVARGGWSRLRGETDASARTMRARVIRATLGPTAATDSLLDRVGTTDSLLDLGDGRFDDPHEQVAAPVTPGRRQGRLRVEARPNRPSRRYRPPARPWERPRPRPRPRPWP